MPTLIQQYRTLKISLEKTGGIQTKQKYTEHIVHQDAFSKIYEELRVETNYLIIIISNVSSEWHEIFK